VSRLERAKRAWAGQFAGLSQAEIADRMRGFATIVRAIATSGGLSPERFAEAVGSGESSAEEFLADLGAIGMQFDRTGRIVGAALSTQESAHKVHVRGKNLYAWCALDTLFIPGLLGETADVESVCAVSGDPIRLRVSPDYVESCEPPDAWVSVFLPGDASRRTGPASPT
jgi:alkylmercury lyase